MAALRTFERRWGSQIQENERLHARDVSVQMTRDVLLIGSCPLPSRTRVTFVVADDTTWTMYPVLHRGSVRRGYAAIMWPHETRFAVKGIRERRSPGDECVSVYPDGDVQRCR